MNRVIPVLLGAVGCAGLNIVPKHFDGPVAAAALAEGEGPFDVATGFVANGRSGTVVPIDLKTNRLLSDDPTASFLRASYIPFGDERLLADVAVVATPTTVDIWTIDNHSGQVLRAPYVTGVGEDGSPVEVEPQASDPTFVDSDASGSTGAVTNLLLRAGYTTTEGWVVEFDGERWWARGEWSGQQDREPIPGETYWSDRREVEFDFDVTNPTVGDRFEFATQTGVQAVDLGALANALLRVDDRMFVSLSDSSVAVLDSSDGTELGRVYLDGGAAPGRLAVDDLGTVYVADTYLPTVHRISGPDVQSLGDDPLPAAAPLVDVAFVGGESAEGVPFRHLFVAPLALQRVDTFDLDTEVWVDANPVTPEVLGLGLDAPIIGLGASAGPVRAQIPTEWGAWPVAPTVVVATGMGTVFQLDAASSCYVAAGTGPTGPNALTDNTPAVFTDVGPPSTPGFLTDATTGVMVTVSACGGVTRKESWTLTYSEADLSWTVEGSRSGLQVKRAYNDQRYVSDTGAISFVMLSGVLPATSGDTWNFATEGNLLVFSSSDPGRDTKNIVTWEFPARPVGYFIEGGPTGGGWDEYLPHQYAILPLTNSDMVARMSLDEGWSDAVWQ